MTARGVRFAEAKCSSSFADEGAAGSDAVVKEFHESLARAPEMAVAVAAIKVRKRLRSFDRQRRPNSRPRPLSFFLSLTPPQTNPENFLSISTRPSRASSSAPAPPR